MPKAVHNLSILTIIFFILSACNLPSKAPATEEPNAVFTAAALTVQAQLTKPVLFSTLTLPAPAITNTPAPTLAPPATLAPLASATPVCDQAQFVKDVNIPDGSQINPGASFTKTWRLRNAGFCSWSGYVLVFDSGDQMGGTPQSFGSVPPGQEVDLSVNFTAPTTSGSYRSYWRIRNSAGVLIPVLGGTQGRSFFVDIKVSVASSGFDLYTRAPDANWNTGAGNIPFGGPDTDTRGFVMYRSNQKLEDGTAPNKILETHPQFVDDGVITGFYPSYTVVSGEHFKAKIGFLAQSDGTCGTGNAKFQLNYKESGSSETKNLGEWTDSCDGTLKDVDANLSSIAGKTVQFALAVLANGSSGQDWAVWVGPQVKIP
ncbi:MAG TPA: NBR1-Ig-like domain-containing protein [Anaerolineales bacterium]|nr:NBR1-Ig-like domain-containing protein [Anaerolineales bacterium]